MYKKLRTAIAAAMLLSIPQASFAQSPDLASVESMAVFTSAGAFNSVGTTSITGDIGTDAGAFTGFPPGVVFGAIQNENAVSAQAALDLSTVYSGLASATCGSVLSVTMGAGQILTPNTYCTGAAATLTGELILDGAGDPSALFIIQIDGAFSAATLSSVTLINGASSCNVYWQINGAVEIGENASFAGNIVSSGAISLLLTSSLNGRALTTAGAIALNSNFIEKPNATTYYADMDGDTYGDALNVITSCMMPAGYVANMMDCDDMNSMVNPAAIEICNLIDDDCNGVIDDLAFVASIYPSDTAFSCKSIDFTFATDSCVDCTYQWFKNDNIIIGATDPTFATNKPAYYSVQVTMPGGCTSTSEHTLLHMDFNPNANIYHPNGLNLCAPTPGINILLKVFYAPTNTYQWYHNDMPYEGVGADTWRIYPTATGTYYCDITTDKGCSRNTPTRTVIDACKIGDINASALLVYPNPAAQEIVVALNVNEFAAEASIQIISILGEIVYTEIGIIQNNILNENIAIANLAPGIYTVNVLVNNTLYTTQLVKQ